MRRLALTLAAAAVLTAVPARADMFTPSFIANDGERAVCSLLNVGKKDLEVLIEIRFNNGQPAGGSTAFTIPPGEVRTVSYDGTNGSRFHCAFVGKVTPKKVRAGGEVVVIATTQTKFVVPAQ
jgi:hypothetical protein